MNILYAFLLFVSVGSCSAAKMGHNLPVPGENRNTNAKPLIVNKSMSNTTVLPPETSKSLNCSGSEGFNIEVVFDSERETRNVRILADSTRSWTIKMPSQMDINGYSLNWAKKTKKGFEISIEYGSRYYYNKVFNFICKEDTFYLDGIEVDSFDKNNPDKANKEHVKIEPQISVEDFDVKKYMDD